MNDIWVCEACRSINRRRDDLCYHCAAPRSGALDTPGLDLRAESAALERGARSYVGSWPLALVTVVLLAAVAVLGVVILRLQAAEYPAMRQAFVDAVAAGRDTVDQALSAQTAQIGLLSLLRLGVTVLALACFAGWLGLVTRNVPLLGGGTPSRSPARVFVYALIPVWNLVKVPGMLQDLLYRVDPEGGGAFMVLAAWIGLVGSYLLSVVGGWIITWAGVRQLIPEVAAGDMGAVLNTFGDVLDQSFWLGVVVAVMVAAGTVLLAVLMVRVEARCAARDREIRAQMAVSGAVTPPTGPSWQAQATPAADPGGASAPPADHPDHAAAPVPASRPREDPQPTPAPPAGSAPLAGAPADAAPATTPALEDPAPATAPAAPPVPDPAPPPDPAPSAPAPVASPSAPYEPHWPAGRPWPGSPNSTRSSSSTDPYAPLPPAPGASPAPAPPPSPASPPPDEPTPGPPPPPPGAPRLG